MSPYNVHKQFYKAFLAYQVTKAGVKVWSYSRGPGTRLGRGESGEREKVWQA